MRDRQQIQTPRDRRLRGDDRVQLYGYVQQACAANHAARIAQNQPARLIGAALIHAQNDLGPDPSRVPMVTAIGSFGSGMVRFLSAL